MSKRKKLLVVDDKETWLATISHILADSFELSLCSNVLQARKAFGENEFDLLILDKNLPDGSGLELLQYFRRSRADIRAIILTDYADVESAVNSMKLGALDYVPKSVPDLHNVLFAKVQEALSVSDSPLFSLIKKGESAVVEFKSSLRWDIRAKQPNKELEKIVVKTIAAFMNSEKECDLLIGVSDDGTVVGIMRDYKTLGQKQNRDGFENHLMSLICDACGKDCAALINIRFHTYNENDVCHVAVRPSSKPIFVKDEKGEHLFVRTGNSTRLLTTKEAIGYCKLRWGS